MKEIVEKGSQLLTNMYVYVSVCVFDIFTVFVTILLLS